MNSQSILILVLMGILGLLSAYYYIEQMIETRTRQRIREMLSATSPTSQNDGCFHYLILMAFTVVIALLVVRG